MNSFFFSHTPHLRLALEQVETYTFYVPSTFSIHTDGHCLPRMDRHEIFKIPVARAEVPDYFDIIKRPMCWKYIDEKLDRNEYFHLKDFQVRPVFHAEDMLFIT